MNVELKIALLRDGRPGWKIAGEAGMSPTVLSRITTGRRPASDEEKESLAQALDTSVESLFPREPVMQAA